MAGVLRFGLRRPEDGHPGGERVVSRHRRVFPRQVLVQVFPLHRHVDGGALRHGGREVGHGPNAPQQLRGLLGQVAHAIACGILEPRDKLELAAVRRGRVVRARGIEVRDPHPEVERAGPGDVGRRGLQRLRAVLAADERDLERQVRLPERVVGDLDLVVLVAERMDDRGRVRDLADRLVGRRGVDVQDFMAIRRERYLDRAAAVGRKNPPLLERANRLSGEQRALDRERLRRSAAGEVRVVQVVLDLPQRGPVRARAVFRDGEARVGADELELRLDAETVAHDRAEHVVAPLPVVDVRVSVERRIGPHVAR